MKRQVFISLLALKQSPLEREEPEGLFPELGLTEVAAALLL
jgi:hypothetical protein